MPFEWRAGKNYARTFLISVSLCAGKIRSLVLVERASFSLDFIVDGLAIINAFTFGGYDYCFLSLISVGCVSLTHMFRIGVGFCF